MVNAEDLTESSGCELFSRLDRDEFQFSMDLYYLSRVPHLKHLRLGLSVFA